MHGIGERTMIQTLRAWSSMSFRHHSRCLLSFSHNGSHSACNWGYQAIHRSYSHPRCIQRNAVQPGSVFTMSYFDAIGLSLRHRHGPKEQKRFTITMKSVCSGRQSMSTQRNSAGKQRQVRVSHVLLAPENVNMKEEIMSRIAGGEDLASMAKEYSVCPSRARGGDLGWVTEGQTVQEFEEAAFGAPLNTVTSAITQFGVHVLVVTDERFMSFVKRVSAQEAEEMIAKSEAESESIQLIDVREDWEKDTASIPGFQLFPLSKFEEWSGSIGNQLDPNKTTLCICHHGIRSQQMAQYLVNEAGFSDVYNIVGGIDAWSRTVNPNIPTY